MGGSFLGGWLAGDLATRGPDRGDEADKLAGELHNERNQLKVERHQAGLNHEVSMASMSAVGAAVGAVMSWKATAHYLQSRLKARRETEAELLEQLTTADVRVPLGEQKAFEEQYDQNFVKALTDPEVIEKTFEDGNIPPLVANIIEKWESE